MTRVVYAFVLEATKPGESDRRVALEEYVNGRMRNDCAAKLFVDSLRDPDLKLVCVRRSSAWLAETLAALGPAGFTRADGDSSFEIWARK